MGHPVNIASAMQPVNSAYVWNSRRVKPEVDINYNKNGDRDEMYKQSIVIGLIAPFTQLYFIPQDLTNCDVITDFVVWEKCTIYY